jgi:hypothetical protein
MRKPLLQLVLKAAQQRLLLLVENPSVRSAFLPTLIFPAGI